MLASSLLGLKAGREWRIGIDFCMAGGFASLCLGPPVVVAE